MRRIALFGSTGSIGTQALDVVRRHADRFEVVCLAAGSSVEALAEQAREFRPRRVIIGDVRRHADLREALSGLEGIEILAGEEDLASAAATDDVDIVLQAVTGARGLPISLAAARAGKRLALANKESVVAAGPLLLQVARDHGSEIIPVDSEHSAIFQCLTSGAHGEVRELVLTGSGGPFRTRPAETFADVTREEALTHPTWSMGPKITVDSATMMNKALEIIEARHLFDVPADRLRVAVHPQSVVHSMVVFTDGSVIAQMGAPDMRVPIQYAMTWPDRLEADNEGYCPTIFDGLTFEKPDMDKFPSLTFGFEAARRGGLAGAVLNAANEACVEAFLDGKIPFPAIFERVGEVLSRYRDAPADSLDAVLAADAWAREEVHRC